MLRFNEFIFNNKAKLDIKQGQNCNWRNDDNQKRALLVPLKQFNRLSNLHTRINSFKKWFDKLVVLKLNVMFIYIFIRIYLWVMVIYSRHIFQMFARMNARIINISLHTYNYTKCCVRDRQQKPMQYILQRGVFMPSNSNYTFEIVALHKNELLFTSQDFIYTFKLCHSMPDSFLI